MKKYLLTFNSLQGTLVFGYNTEGFLILVENKTSMTNESIAWLFANIPIQLEQMQSFAQRCKANVELIPEDLSFGVFWDAYDKKINKIRCEAIYKKLSDTERLKCIQNVKHYNAYLQRSGFRAKADPENYLKKAYYLTDWKKEK